MSIVLNVSIRMYLQDVVGSTDDVVEKLTEVSNNISGGKLYFWYEEGDKVNIKDFITKWESKKHNNMKTIIRPHYFDNQNDFIWYDIMPKKLFKKLPLSNQGFRNYYTRFTYQYVDEQGMIRGLKEFQKTYDFVTNDKPVRKQKRNDGEDSNNRK